MIYSGIEKRRYQRYSFDISIHISGIDRQGNLLEEDTYTYDISQSGIRFISTCDFDPEKELTVTIHLLHALGEDVKPGDWVTKARIIRVGKITKTDSGQLKNQELCLNFNFPLGVTPSEDPWKQSVD